MAVNANWYQMWADPTIKEEIQYSMPKFLADALIRAEKLSGKKVNNPQQFLCDYVNREFGLKGHVTQVMTY